MESKTNNLPTSVMFDLQMSMTGEVRYVRVTGRVRAYWYISRHPGVGIEKLLEVLEPMGVELKDLPAILNPLALEDGGYIRITREEGQIRLYSKDPHEKCDPMILEFKK